MTTDDEMVTIREYFDREILSIRREIEHVRVTIRETAEAHVQSHTREHQQTQLAVTKAEEALAIRLSQMNEFREQITNERGSYLTKDESVATTKRLEELIERGVGDLVKYNSRMDDRVNTIERALVGIQGNLVRLDSLLKDVDQLKSWQQNTQGRGAVVALGASAIAGIISSVLVGLILFVVLGNT